MTRRAKSQPILASRPLFNPATHRKLVKHYDDPGQMHELTFSCYQRMPLLNDQQRCRFLSQSITRATARHSFEIIAFVFMPEHVHLIVYPVKIDASVSQLLYAIKRPSSYQFKKIMEKEDNPLLQKLMIRERPGKSAFRFWQEGSGYDRNIRNKKTLQSAIEYVHNNPVKRGLCQVPEEWKWSSFRTYFDSDVPPDHDLPVVHGWPD